MKIYRNFSSRIIGRVCTAMLTLCTISANAQQTESGESAQIINFSAKEALRAEDAAQILAKRLQLNPATDELRSAYIEKPGDGLQVQRFNQYYKGVRVEHGTFTLTSKNGVATYAFGKFYPTAAISGIAPQMDEATALTKALAAMPAEKYGWETGSAEYPTGKLTFTEDFSSGDGDGLLHLAYAFDVYTEIPLGRSWVYIDARSGKVLMMDAIMKHVNVAANGASLYSDTVAFNAAQVSGLNYLHDSTRGALILTYKLNNTTSVPSSSTGIALSSALQVTSATTTFARDAAVDAHWGATKVYEYWKSVHNRDSWNGTNGVLRSFVHYGVNYNNAMWNGSTMIYGDGSGTSAGFPPLTSLDVCAHEFGHGVCQSTAGLVYSRESGAMNEGFSDIWGAVIEAGADPHEFDAVPKNTWLIGEELINTLRSMSNPKQHGQPNTYLGINWIYTGPGCVVSQDNCGVHTNSGVLNYWFYLLTVGGKGTNDVNSVYNVEGIGMAKAAKIAYATELALNSTATYAAARTASIAAATTLYGACSPEVEAVTRAWYAVGVGNNYTPCIPEVSFNGQTGNVSEDAGLNNCFPSHVVNVPVTLNGPALTGDSAVITPIIIGGTAVAGIDYDLVTPTVTFPAGGPATQNISFRVYDNGVFSANKYIDLTYTLSAGASNAIKSVYMDTIRVAIVNDDYFPYSGTDEQRPVLNYNTIGNTSSPFAGNNLNAHAQYLYRAQELTAAGVRPGVPMTHAAFFIMSKYSSKPFQGYTMKLAHTTQPNLSSGVVTTGFTTVYSDTLSTELMGWSPIPFSAPFIWNGTDNLVVEICFANDTTFGANDRVQSQSGSYVYSAIATSGFNPGCAIPLTVNNLVSARPLIRFTQHTPVETALNSTRTWNVNAAPQEVYFYSHGPKKLMAAIVNPTDSLGCVTTTITGAGNGFSTLAGGTKRSVKEFLVTPGRQLSSVSYEGIFYFRNEELAGVDPYSLKVVQTTSVDDNSMLPGNTRIVTPTDVILGLEYTGFRGTFTGFNRFFLSDGRLFLGVDDAVAQSSELWTGANPFQTAPVLHWNLAASERVSIRLYDITGKLVYGNESTLDAGRHQKSLTGNSDFAPGTYVLQVVRPSGVFTRQLIKQ